MQVSDQKFPWFVRDNENVGRVDMPEGISPDEFLDNFTQEGSLRELFMNYPDLVKVMFNFSYNELNKKTGDAFVKSFLKIREEKEKQLDCFLKDTPDPKPKVTELRSSIQELTQSLKTLEELGGLEDAVEKMREKIKKTRKDLKDQKSLLKEYRKQLEKLTSCAKYVCGGSSIVTAYF